MLNGTMISTALASRQYPRRTIASWTLPGIAAGSQSTELIEIEIPGMFSADSTDIDIKGDADVIQLVSFSVDSTSTDFDISILNRGDISLLDTIYEVAKFTAINLSGSDSDMGAFLIRNRDDEDSVRKNKLYIYIKNDDGSNATGDIRLELGFLIFDSKK